MTIVTLVPFVGGSLPVALALMAVWGAGLGAIGIYNQSAILRAGRENKDAANGLTVLTIQLGITIGALYGSAALVVAGPLLVPAAAALPVIAALLVTFGGRKAAYPPGPSRIGVEDAAARRGRSCWGLPSSSRGGPNVNSRRGNAGLADGLRIAGGSLVSQLPSDALPTVARSACGTHLATASVGPESCIACLKVKTYLPPGRSIGNSDVSRRSPCPSLSPPV